MKQKGYWFANLPNVVTVDVVTSISYLHISTKSYLFIYAKPLSSLIIKINSTECSPHLMPHWDDIRLIKKQLQLHVKCDTL